MIQRFAEYALSFERAYESQDFEPLKAYFTEDAVYTIHRPGLPPIESSGREAVLEFLRWITEGFDRKFETRQILRVDGPHALADGAIEVHGVAVYTLPSKERCHLSMSEAAYFRGDRIERLVDRITPGGRHEMECIVSGHPELFDPEVLGLAA